MSGRIKGHDYKRGVDLELTGAQWRSLLSEADYTRRVGTGVLAFERREGVPILAFEIYDDEGALKHQRPGART